MNIIDAVKRACEKNVGIRNNVCKLYDNYLLPTNTDECFLIIPLGYKLNDDTKRAAPRWNPKTEDILNDDWELYPD